MNSLYMAADHAGYALKQKMIAYAQTHYPEWDIVDLGTDSDASIDYPEFGFKAAHAVTGAANARGVIICGSGIGISIAANRVAGARAALCSTGEMAEMARKHNNANILALGARMVDEQQAQAIIDAFMRTEFEGGRHERRAAQLG